MATVDIRNCSANRALEIVRELRDNFNLKIGVDYDWQYYPSLESYKPKKVSFTFYEDKWATWFTMRYK